MRRIVQDSRKKASVGLVGLEGMCPHSCTDFSLRLCKSENWDDPATFFEGFDLWLI